MKIRQAILVAALTLIVAAGTSLITWRLHAQTQTAAFVALRRETIYKIPSNEPYIVQNSEFSRKTDGSEVAIRTNVLPSGEVTAHKIIVDAATRTRSVVDTATESVTTYASSEYVSGVLQQLSACTADASAQRSDNILGYETLKTLKESSLPHNGHKIKVEKWVAPTLGCFALRQKTYLVDSHGMEALSNYVEVLSVKEGDPPISNFAIPTTFTERSPSAVMTEFARRHPDAADSLNAPSTHLEKRDEAYYLQQKR